MLIPEFRIDNGSSTMFLDSNLAPTKTASQVAIAMVYGF